MTNEFSLPGKNIYFLVLFLSKYDIKKNFFNFIYLDGHLNNTDDSHHKQQQQQSPAAHFSKRKASFR
jgi:hypothetical protein